jgi:hypothetical protein
MASRKVTIYCGIRTMWRNSSRQAAGAPEEEAGLCGEVSRQDYVKDRRRSFMLHNRSRTPYLSLTSWVVRARAYSLRGNLYYASEGNKARWGEKGRGHRSSEGKEAARVRPPDDRHIKINVFSGRRQPYRRFHAPAPTSQWRRSCCWQRERDDIRLLRRISLAENRISYV